MEKNKPRKRSSKYPYYSLKTVLPFLRKIDELGGEGVGEQSIRESMGIKHRTTRSFSGRVSSAKQFGLLEEKGTQMSLSRRANQVLYPSSPEAESQALRAAVVAPVLYAKLIDRFSGKRIPPLDTLGNLLATEYGIAKPVRTIAAQAFVESLQFAGLLSDDYVLTLEQSEKQATERFATPDASATGQSPPTPEHGEREVSTTKEALQVSEGVLVQEIRLASGRKARFQIPDGDITENDVERMKKLLDLLRTETGE